MCGSPAVPNIRARPSEIADSGLEIRQFSDFSYDGSRNLKRKRFRQLGKQRPIDITIRNPDDSPVAIVESGDHVRDVDSLAALIQQGSAQNVSAFAIGLNFLVHHPDYRIG